MAFVEKSTEEQVDWVDGAGRVLETLSRGEIRRRNLLHKISATLVFHPDGRLFMHQRSPEKDVFPSYLDLCVGGTVVSGESHALNAVRELEEELGISGEPVYFLFDHHYEDQHSKGLVHLFACVAPGPFRLQGEEIAWGEWVSEQEATAALTGNRPLCPDSAQGWRLYLERFGSGRNFQRELAPRLESINGFDML